MKRRGEHWILDRRRGERLGRPETGIEFVSDGERRRGIGIPIIFIRLPGWTLTLRGSRIKLP